MKQLIEVLKDNLTTGKRGVYSVCSAHPLVIEAAMRQAAIKGESVLIEATANQVNQFGGYTGMTPGRFVEFVQGIANKVNFPLENIILGGDHLGPVCWVNESVEQAMSKSAELISSYVAAGFKKIHLDTSMRCEDDPDVLPDEIIAKRAAILCRAAEQTAIECFGVSDLVYVVGTEVPVPGGATEDIGELEVTPVENVRQTIEYHIASFKALKLDDAIKRIIAIVVQPGVEFDHTQVVDYQSDKAQRLASYILTCDGLVFEAHSTDYQRSEAYKRLIADHFAILKVGPQLTFAMREALFSLSYIEDALIPLEDRSYLRDVCDGEMLEKPANWQKYYQVPAKMQQFYRFYSYSDRIRYYWCEPRVTQAVEKLLNNLSKVSIPLPLINQFLPEQYQKVRTGELSCSPTELVINKIMQVTDVYASACNQTDEETKATS